MFVFSVTVSQKLEWKAEAKIPKATDAKHKAGGGNVEIIDRKLEWKAEAKIPKATEASKHKPGGGNVEICQLTNFLRHKIFLFSSEPFSDFLLSLQIFSNFSR